MLCEQMYMMCVVSGMALECIDVACLYESIACTFNVYEVSLLHLYSMAFRYWHWKDGSCLCVCLLAEKSGKLMTFS